MLRSTLIMSLCLSFFGLSAAWGAQDKDQDLADFFKAGEKLQIIFQAKNKVLAERICRVVKKALAKEVSSQCYINEPVPALTRYNQYQLRIDQKVADKIEVSFTVNKKGEDDIDQVTWSLENQESIQFDEVLGKIAKSIVEYDRYSPLMKDMLFYHGILQSSRIKPAGDMFQIYENGRLTKTVNKDLAKREFIRERKENKNFLRGGLEVATFLGIGKALYIMGHDSMMEDWDFDNKTASDFKRRIFSTEQMKFDDNAVSMNWGHAYAGVLYYSSARNNGFTSYESLMVSMASSSIWEYAGEYKEVVSINDQIITGIGGAIIGETLYQISNMLKQRDSQIARVIGAVINPVGTLNDVLDGKGVFHAHENFTKRLGFDSEGFSSVDIISGIKMASNRKANQNTTMAEVGFDGSVINLPVEGAGNIQTVVIDPTMAELFILGAVSQDGIEDWQAVTKLALGGYFSKNVELDEKNNLHGHSFLIAPAVRTEYTSHGDGHSKDFYAMVNVIGGTMDVTYYTGGNKIRFSIDVYADFAMVRPYGLEQFKNAGGDLDHAKSVLTKREYYYAAGGTGIMKLSYQNGKNEFGVNYTHHQFTSIDNKSLNRHVDLVTNDVSMDDKLDSIKVYYTRSISEKYKVSMGLERIFREGTMDSVNTGEELVSREDVEDRMWIQLMMKL